MAFQLSIFIENKPGKLEKITNLLAKNRFNVRGISMANAGEFGIVKIVVDNPEEAVKMLLNNNVTVSLRKIVAVRIDDRPGALHDLLTILSSNEINIDDCYGVSIAYNKGAAIILEGDNNSGLEEVLIKNSIIVLSDKEIYSL